MVDPLQNINFSLDFGKLDYMVLLLPVTGFFFIYMLIPWLREELGFGQMFIYVFPILFGVASYFSYSVALSYFYGNQATLAGVDIALFNLDHFALFIGSAFIYFVLAGIGGWGARVLIENFEGIPVEDSKKHKSSDSKASADSDEE